jgi:5-methylcytosine-specific restriction enzyme A
MPIAPATFRPPGWQPRIEKQRGYDRKRQGDPVRRLKKTSRWQKLRAEQLRAEPLCRMHSARGEVVEATICDHVEPHRGDLEKFWAGPFQSLCKACHDGEKQRLERAVERPGGGESKGPSRSIPRPVG